MKQYAGVGALLAACTIVGTLILPLLSITDIAMLYLVAAGLAATRVGRGPSMFAAFLAIALFDFFFVPPRFTFAVADLHYVLTFAVMLGSALAISSVAHRLRGFADAARERERRTAALYTMSRELDPTMGLDALIGVITRHVRDAFSAQVQVLLRGPDGVTPISAGATPAYEMDDKELGVARWTFEHWQAAGVGTEHFPEAQALYVPLVGAAGRVGVMGVRPDHPALFRASTVRQVLDTFAGQAAQALEHAQAAATERAGAATGR
jgi:two-component system sensor histidine kinase KdpD